MAVPSPYNLGISADHEAALEEAILSMQGKDPLKSSELLELQDLRDDCDLGSVKKRHILKVQNLVNIADYKQARQLS
ncbi:hypothetical protein N7457_000622 [Penicillium paradoxum]|uniref:uncharacterized protein n=1 Tax=Penicillium paradoxum TaxID=176176 RepID=UPI00254660F8|nr:uncharacterized protein N7457_000622 [Penicillium paradoxum]KAJ5794023.1 hypothetical protein N7457_000622 [Penicillium paradoxum]